MGFAVDQVDAATERQRDAVADRQAQTRAAARCAGALRVGGERLEQALAQLDEFRLHEGKVTEEDLAERVKLIKDKLKKIEPLEEQRIVNLKERIRKNLREFTESENYDVNRLEQELFYYLEKLDITEEKVRLLKHCDYFL